MKSSKSDTALRDIRKIVSGAENSSKKGTLFPQNRNKNTPVLELRNIVGDGDICLDSRLQNNALVLEDIDSSMRVVGGKKVKAKNNNKSAAGHGHSMAAAEVKQFVKKLKRAKKPNDMDEGLGLTNDDLNKCSSTMEEVVIALLKPQLSHWLEKNLSSIVKAAVEREISNIMKEEEDDDD